MKNLKQKFSIAALILTVVLCIILLCSCSSGDEEAKKSVPVVPPILSPGISIDEDTLSFTNVNTVGDFLSMQPDKNYRLNADLDFSSVEKTLDEFSGKFDGAGHIISNIQRPLFINNSGQIFNLNINSCNLTKFEDKMSVICVNNSGLLGNISIQNVILAISTHDKDFLFGAVCAVNDGEVYNCYSECKIDIYNPLGSLNIGLLVGENKNKIISSFSAPSEINTEYESEKFIIGDICGINTGKVINCYSSDESAVTMNENAGKFSNRLGLYENSINLMAKNWCVDNLGWEDSEWHYSTDNYPTIIPDVRTENIRINIKKKLYPIKNASDLSNINNEPNASYYLISDIDLDGAEWTPIGNSEFNSFAGEFFGEGHVISNFKITNANRFIGFFGYLTGNVYNLGIENYEIVSNDEQNFCIGGIAGVLENGKISNVYSDGNIKITKYSGQTNIGMIVGLNRNGKISYSYGKGAIACAANSNLINLGGLIGSNYQWGSDFSIFNCFAAVEITANGFYYNIEPIIGYNEGTYNKIFCANNQINVLLNGEKANLRFGMTVQMQYLYDHNWIRDAVEFDRSIWKYDETGEQTELIKLIKK